MISQRIIPAVFILFLLASCRSPDGETGIYSSGRQDFSLRVADDDLGQSLLAQGRLSCKDCRLTLDTIAGRSALRLATTAEFSDARINLYDLLGHPIDFRSGGYLYFDLFIPKGSEIMSVKFNHGDAEGNFGGCGDHFNHVAGNRGRWITVEVPMEEQYALCQNWTGEGDPFAATTVLTVNPYNANRVDTGILFFNNLVYRKAPISGQYVEERLAARPRVADNNPYRITFDDPELLAQQQAYRTFEATTQYLTTGKFGNPTKSIRSYGTGANNYICLLPDVEQMTGHPVNFHEVDSLYFSYYLTQESDSVGGMTLFLTTGDDWDGILRDTAFMQKDDFQRGAWTRYAVALKDLDLEQVRGEQDVLTELCEMRFDLHYTKDAGPIEIWYDDIGWK